MEGEKQRFIKLAKSTAQILILGVVYYLLVTISGVKIPCTFYVLTGKYCPGCGVTRMCLALAQMDFEAAMRNNLLVFLLLGPGLLYGLIKGAIYIKKGTVRQTVFENICFIIIFILAVIFTIVRNTSYGVFLQPL